MSTEILVLAIWLSVVSAVSLIATVYDKWASRRSRKNRVPEKWLFLLAAAGGSAVMYLTMLIVRHKTKHKRFMLGIPVLILLQYGLALYFLKCR